MANALRDVLDVPSDGSNLSKPVDLNTVELDGSNAPVSYTSSDKAFSVDDLVDATKEHGYEFNSQKDGELCPRSTTTKRGCR
jgi:hypothetical protein